MSVQDAQSRDTHDDHAWPFGSHSGALPRGCPLLRPIPSRKITAHLAFRCHPAAFMHGAAAAMDDVEPRAFAAPELLDVTFRMPGVGAAGPAKGGHPSPRTRAFAARAAYETPFQRGKGGMAGGTGHGSSTAPFDSPKPGRSRPDAPGQPSWVRRRPYPLERECSENTRVSLGVRNGSGPGIGASGDGSGRRSMIRRVIPWVHGSNERQGVGAGTPTRCGAEQCVAVRCAPRPGGRNGALAGAGKECAVKRNDPGALHRSDPGETPMRTGHPARLKATRTRSRAYPS